VKDHHSELALQDGLLRVFGLRLDWAQGCEGFALHARPHGLGIETVGNAIFGLKGHDPFALDLDLNAPLAGATGKERNREGGQQREAQLTRHHNVPSPGSRIGACRETKGWPYILYSASEGM
jgi:hypothetical protein